MQQKFTDGFVSDVASEETETGMPGMQGMPESPPEWHGTKVNPVEFRSLMHDDSSFSEHNHEQAELILHLGMTRGEVSWRDAEGAAQSASVAAQECCLIPAGIRHVVHGLNVEGAVSLLIGGALLAEVVRRNVNHVLVGNLRHLTAHDLVAGGLISEFERMLARQPQVCLLNAVGLTIGFKILQALLYRPKDYADHSAPAFNPPEQERVLDYLREHLSECLDVSRMARHMAMSRTHFARRFRATFGVPPLQYALKMRVDRALDLLRAGDCRVAEAAHAAGFFDQSHFDRHCRKFYGQPPRVLLHL
jgi:AraC family transcriptional regulator